MMFDLAWSEIALIAVVAVIVIGPKDLPDAVRGVARMVRKARAMASEFQGQADELVREANLHEVRDSLNEIRNFNIRDTIEKTVDKDGTIRQTFTEDPLRDHPHTPPATDSTATGSTATGSLAGDSLAAAADTAPATEPTPMPEGPPAFVPPPPAEADKPPAFIPPGASPPVQTS